MKETGYRSIAEGVAIYAATGLVHAFLTGVSGFFGLGLASEVFAGRSLFGEAIGALAGGSVGFVAGCAVLERGYWSAADHIEDGLYILRRNRY